MEYLIGVNKEENITDENLERVEQDHYIICEKYNLPPHYMMKNPETQGEYEEALLERLASVGYSVRSTQEIGKFFKEFRFAGAAHDGENKIIFIDKNNHKYNYKKVLNENMMIDYLVQFTHESIHALQPERMPIELAEYEAYVGAGFNWEKIKEDNKFFYGIFLKISASVGTYYKQEGIKPIWNNPGFFLEKVDNLSKEEIKTYLEKSK